MVLALVLLAVVAVIVIVGGLIVMSLYNGLQRRKLNAENAWSDIDVQLKRRHDLIPNLVNTVKGYASHEKETFEGVTQARAAAMGAEGVAAQAGAENMLTQALGKLFAVSEAYPDLKANQNFLSLQEELTSTENKIGFARQHYNRSVNQYNEATKTFPSNIIAGMFGFSDMNFFELDEAEAAAVKKAPDVQF
ncbi:MAG: LemA family protein [Planctomycetota bacterium]|nr:LemA family protein [Planctomycetota bacterium]MEE2895754.1 LemA family protein [Planctomycetota bacterium]